MGTKPRDVILLLAIVALVVLAFIPTGDDESTPAPTASDRVPEEVPPAYAANEREPDRVPPTTARAAPPLVGVPHELFPIVPGSRWTYRVAGPAHLAPADTWTLEIRSAPADGEPGVVEVGFGDAREQRSLWLEDGALRLDGLPCVEPMEFFGNRAREIRGSLLPPMSSIVIGAVWHQEYERQVTHEIRDERGRVHARKALAVQRDRAIAKEIHEVDVPAGRFDSRRIEWIGRVSISVGKRPVLDGLTSEPYRSETTWFAPGVGLVRRRVAYGESMKNSVTFNLVEYHRPGG